MDTGQISSLTINRCRAWNNGLSSLHGALIHCICNRTHNTNRGLSSLWHVL